MLLRWALPEIWPGTFAMMNVASESCALLINMTVPGRVYCRIAFRNEHYRWQPEDWETNGLIRTNQRTILQWLSVSLFYFKHKISPSFLDIWYQFRYDLCRGNQENYLSCLAVWQMLVSSSWLITDQLPAGCIVSGYFSFHSSGHPPAARTGVRVIPPICHCVTSHQTQYTLQLLCCYIFAFSPFVKNVGWEGHDSGHL